MSTPTIKETIENVNHDFQTALEEMDVELMQSVARRYKEMGWDDDAEEARLLANAWNDADWAYDNAISN